MNQAVATRSTLNGVGGGNELATLAKPDMQLSVYDKVDPMTFIEKMGKAFAQSGAGGCKLQSDGEVMALACLCKKQDIFQISARYHLMNGKLVVKSETMLADFRKAGGKHKWLKDGSDYLEASLQLTDADGNSIVSSFTFDKAKAAGYVKSGSNWDKRPDQMLRSRCITDGIRMLCPEISGGHYSEDEIEDVGDNRPARTVTQTRSKQEVAKRAEELKAMAANSGALGGITVENKTVTTNHSIQSTTTEQPPFDVNEGTTGDANDSVTDGEVIDASFTVVNGEVQNTVQNAVQSQSAEANQAIADTMEIEILIGQLGHKVHDLLEKYNKKNGTSYGDFGELTDQQRTTLITNLRKGVADHEAKKVAEKNSTSA